MATRLILHDRLFSYVANALDGEAAVETKRDGMGSHAALSKIIRGGKALAIHNHKYRNSNGPGVVGIVYALSIEDRGLPEFYLAACFPYQGCTCCDPFTVYNKPSQMRDFVFGPVRYGSYFSCLSHLSAFLAECANPTTTLYLEYQQVPIDKGLKLVGRGLSRNLNNLLRNPSSLQLIKDDSAGQLVLNYATYDQPVEEPHQHRDQATAGMTFTGQLDLRDIGFNILSPREARNNPCPPGQEEIEISLSPEEQERLEAYRDRVRTRVESEGLRFQWRPMAPYEYRRMPDGSVQEVLVATDVPTPPSSGSRPRRRTLRATDPERAGSNRAIPQSATARRIQEALDRASAREPSYREWVTEEDEDASF